MRVKVDPKDAAKEFAEFTRRMRQGRELLDKTKDKDVQIATTPKREVFRTDKTVLYRYEPTAKKTVGTPVLIVYGLVGRYTMADLQEDRPPAATAGSRSRISSTATSAIASTSSAGRRGSMRCRSSASARAASSPRATRREIPAR
jgi:hypothetical protein